MKALSEADSVLRVCGDRCQFDAEIQRGVRRGHPIKKPFGFLTDPPCLAEALSAPCLGLVESAHVPREAVMHHAQAAVRRLQPDTLEDCVKPYSVQLPSKVATALS